MRVLGITDGQTSGAAIFDGYRILAAINEERISRIKLARGFPRDSIREVLKITGTDVQDLTGIAVAQVDMQFREQVTGWPGWFEAREEGSDTHSRFWRLASQFGGLIPYVPGLRKAYYALREPVYRQRRTRLNQILREEFGITAPVKYYQHHYAHAASTYLTSGFDDALVVTMDGGGDGHSSHIYSVRGGKFEKLQTISSYDSVGNYYAYVTAICGFKAKRHEGKITGLAARGEPVFRQMFDELIGYEQGRTVNRGKVVFGKALKRIGDLLPENWQMEDLASTIQQLSEDVASRYVEYWLDKTGHRNVALAGGLFANVRINEEIYNLEQVEKIFIHPGMTDEGLAVGAGVALVHDLETTSGKNYTPQHLPTVYLGNAYSDEEIRRAIDEAGLDAMHLPGAIEKEVAERLAQGKVVARFAGAMEYGPRALGNRSILYQPGDPTVNDWLNELLQRTEFMPFAPACLYEEADKLFLSADGALDPARFMTITFHCTEWMAERCQGVVHVDNTARPQLVRQQDNPSFWRIIDEYRKLTGVPVVINTSFNIHEEPIVRTPQDAIRAFLDSSLDYLAMGDFMITGPVGSAATRDKWKGRSSKWGHAVESPTSR